MPAGTFTLYSANKDDVNVADLLGLTLKIGLVSSAYTPNNATGGHSLWSSVSSNEIANGNGYTTGGATLGTLASTAITGGWKFTTANPSWTASGGNIPAWRYAVMYVSGTVWGMTNPVIGYFIGDDTPADIPATTAGNTLTLVCPSDGWFDVT